MADEVRAGLLDTPKTLPSKYFYDARGSALFEEITHQPEYYPPQAEMEILESVGETIVADVAPRELVELGSGSSRKTRLLLEAMHLQGNGCRYVPFDVSEDALEGAAAELRASYPWLEIRGVVGDFERHIPEIPRGGTGLVAFLGSTIGNFAPRKREEFLRDVKVIMTGGDALLIGFDLVKDVRILEAAYDDAAGITAAFNRNVLLVLNRELSANFPPDAFEHVSFFDRENSWIEMRLRAVRALDVRLGALDLVIHCDPGEEIRTEISCKFTRERAGRDLRAAGLRLLRWEPDSRGRFAVALADVAPPPR